MQFGPGTRLGPYELMSPLGTGGMGEVYEARDTRLNRRVALKVVRAVGVTDDGEARARFEREALAIAALNHPNICTLYDTGREGEVEFLVMERLEGESLAQRLARGPLSIGEVTAWAAQIADALDFAHRRGVVHRDLKPANVMLVAARGGEPPHAKLLDFGVARLQAAAVADGFTQPVTLTRSGSIVGTLQYMAPEQVEGREADARADIFSFGALVYEMLAGRPAFDAPSQARLISAVLESEPRPLTDVRPDAPPALRLLVESCLVKDPEQRWASAHDARIVLRRLSDLAGARSAPSDVSHRFLEAFGRRPVVWSLLPLAVVMAVAALVIGVVWLRPPPSRPLDVLSILPPVGTTLTVGDAPQVSPDGRTLAFVATDAAGRTLLYLRDLGSASAHPVAGTDDAALPFWSPDNRQIGFFARGSLKTVPAGGGRVQTLAAAPVPRGGSWGSRGDIVFVPYPNSLPEVVPETGGPSRSVPVPASVQERRWFPSFLPDGRHYLYSAIELQRRTGVAIRVASLDSTELVDLVPSTSSAVYAEPGYLLRRRDGALVAQRFNASSLETEGEVTVLAEQVGMNAIGSQGLFSASATGVVAFLPPYSGWRMTWVDRSGRRLGAVGAPGQYNSLCMTLDGKWIVYDQADPQSGSMDLWALNLARDATSRLTFDPSIDFYPACSKSGDEVAFGSLRSGAPSIFRLRITEPGTERLARPPGLAQLPTDWSRDGRWLLYAVYSQQTSWDLWAMRLDGDPRQAIQVAATPADERSGRFSPDGRFVAYRLQQGDDAEVVVEPFPPTTARWQVSRGGGRQPVWSPDGRTLFYLSPDKKLMAASIEATGATLTVGPPSGVLETRVVSIERDIQGTSYQVTPDGQRFLVLESGTEATPVTLLLNWPRRR